VAADAVDPAVLEDLAAASRILVDQGVFDAAGHVSMRHPERADRFLMSRSLAPELVVADDIMEFTLDCAPCNDSRKPFIERFLHGGIYQKRADVMAVAHGHSAAVIPFGLVNTPMRATYHNAAFLAAGVPVFDIRDRFGATDIVISDERVATVVAGSAVERELHDVVGGHQLRRERARHEEPIGALRMPHRHVTGGIEHSLIDDRTH
jgi:ribulose-5-phosphate 4-epimerase/fuculose-1-phosphate aldolase